MADRSLRGTTLILSLALILTFVDRAHALLTRTDARAIATTQVIAGSPTEATLFAYLYRTTAADSVIQPGESVRSGDRARSVGFTATAPTYFVYIDDHPMAHYEHPVRYVFIDANSGGVTVIGANGLPGIGADAPYALAQERFESPDLFYADFTPYLSPPVPPAPVRARDTARELVITAGGTCGIIVKGPMKAGEDPGADSAKASSARRATKIMKDKGVGMITEVSPAGGSDMGHQLAMAGKGKDKLWVYYTGHGWSDGEGGTGPCFPGATTTADSFPTWKDIACSLAMSGVKNVCVILDCCYAGGAIAQFQMKGIPGVIATACDAESTSMWWAKTDPSGNLVSSDDHYTKALAACFESPAADKDVPPNGVDLKEAHAWARKDLEAAKQKPPEIGVLTKLGVKSVGSFVIPSALVNPAFYTAQGMASDWMSGAIYCVFTPTIPGSRPTLVTVTSPPGPTNVACSIPPFVQPTADVARGTAPDQFLLTNGPQVYLTNFCNPGPAGPFRPFSGLGRDADAPLAWGAYLGADELRSFADQIALGSGTPQPTGVTAEIIHTMRPPHAPLEVRDMDKAPLGVYDTSHFYDVTFTLAQGPQPMVEFHTLDMDPVDGPRFLNLGNATLSETPQAAGLAAHMGPLTQSGAALSDTIPVTLYVLDAIPLPTGWRVLQYDVLGLTTSNIVGVPFENGAHMAVSPRPNPSLGPVTFAFRVERAADAQLSVYDARGRLVRVVLDRTVSDGPHAIRWDGRTADGAIAPPGVYMARLTANGMPGEASRPFVILR